MEPAEDVIPWRVKVRTQPMFFRLLPPDARLCPKLLLALLSLVPFLPSASGGEAPRRSIAVTVDDLPAMNAMDLHAAAITTINRRILAALTASKAPAIGFVNEERLYRTGEADARIGVLRSWLDGGFELGNHTFSHTSLSQSELDDWEDDVVQGESVTRLLQRPRHLPLRYLRFPYLDEGADLKTRRAAAAFLKGRGYTVAPVTIDPRDWYFADLYDEAHQHGDRSLEARLGRAYVAYAEAVLHYDEARCRQLLGREPKQILLLHDTWLEADHLPELLAMLRRNGYRFITLTDALTDPAYGQPDDFVSKTGSSAIEHWAYARGEPRSATPEPQVPQWVETLHAAYDARHPDD